ncbi:MAG TPA: VanZ family protein [Patescibacteria group bacterium]|nr:VanZ family protein [Patescibacteria group bacterium]
MTILFWRWGPAIAWAGLIFYLSSIPQLEVTSEPVGNFLTRKAAHLAEYAVLFLLILRATQFKRPGLSLTLTLLYALTDELHQSLIPTRTAKLEDLAFDAAGALLGGAAWKYFPAALMKLKS